MAEIEERMDTIENRQDELERRANRIIKIFGQITECLNGEEVARIKEMLSKIIAKCRNKEQNYMEDLNQIYQEYLLMVEFRAGISVNLIKLSLESFLKIEDNPEILGKKVNDMFMEMILTEHPTLALDMKLSDELLKAYFRLLSKGSEPALHMRLMIVGMFGVGKTSLVRRLCSRNVNDVVSTEGVDIFMETCEVEENGDWVISPGKKREHVFNERLQMLLEKFKKENVTKRTNERESYTEQVSQEESETIQPKSISPLVEPERKHVDEKEYYSKVNEKDLKERTHLNTASHLKRRPTISIWDFAGQSVYYSTHHFFLNERSIYLLVLDLSKELDDMVEEGSSSFLPNFIIGNESKLTCLEAFKFWLKSIYIYTKQKETHSSKVSRPKYTPVVVLIGTHKDKITENQLNGRTHEQYKDEYFEKALKAFTRRPMADLVHRKKFLVNNLDPSDVEKSEFLEMKKEIFNIAKSGEVTLLNEPIPAHFIPLERSVFHSKAENKTIMSFGELQEENRKIEFPSSNNDIELFLAFQHAFGNVIYFNTETLHDMVILTPQWIIDVFKAFVSHIPNKKLSEQEEWNALKHNGILQKHLIDELLSFREDLKSLKDKIIKYMEHMDVIVKPVNFQCRTGELLDFFSPRSQDTSNITHTVENLDYIMPCMLPPIPEKEELARCFKPAVRESYTPTLCMYFKECFLPPFVTHCLLASFVKKLKIREWSNKMILYNGLGSFCFQGKQDRYLTVWSFEDTLHFKINFVDNVSANDKTQFCNAWRKIIEELVIKIFNFHGKDTYTRENVATLFEYRIKCPKCHEQVPCEQKFDCMNQTCDYIHGLFNVSDLLDRRDRNIKCPSCCEITPAEDILQDWFEISHDIPEISDVEDCLLDSPKEDRLADLSKEIPDVLIRKLAVELSIRETMVEHLEAKRTDTDAPCHFIYHVLHIWKKRDESWNVLYKALLKAKVHIEKAEFFRIIEGEESQDILDEAENCLKKIQNYQKRKTGNVSSRIDLHERVLTSLSDCIGSEFWSLGVRLGVRHTTIEQWMIKFKNDCKIVNLEILRQWNKSNADLIELIKAMVKSGTDMQAVREVLQTAFD